MRTLVINCSAPHYNLGARKLVDWLRTQGDVVKYEREILDSLPMALIVSVCRSFFPGMPHSRAASPSACNATPRSGVAVLACLRWDTGGDRKPACRASVVLIPALSVNVARTV